MIAKPAGLQVVLISNQTMQIICAILAVLVLVHLFYRVKNHRRIRLAAAFPGPINWPCIGGIWRLMNVAPDKLIGELRDMCTEYGGVFHLWRGIDQLVFVISAQRYAKVLLSHSTKYQAKSDGYGYMVPLIRNCMFLSAGQQWRNLRKIATPAFHFRILERFEEIFEHQSRVLVDRLAELTDGRVVDIHAYVTLMALDNIYETSMGTKLNSQLDAKATYLQAAQNVTQGIIFRVSRLWSRSTLLAWLFAYKIMHRQRQGIRDLHALTKRIIQTRREEMQAHEAAAVEEQEEAGEGEAEGVGVKKRYALLDVLLRSTIDGRPLRDDEIQDEVESFTFAGHDTVSSAISFTLYLLSRHQAVQDKVYAEIEQEITNNNGSTKGILPNLRYLELVVKEALRLYPSIPTIGRLIEEDTQIDEHLTMPAHSNVHINLFAMFRDPSVFQRPDDFWPERFEQPDYSAGPYAYCPFSAGPKNCIGNRYAMQQMKITLVNLLRSYEFGRGDAEPVLVIELTLQSANGVRVRVARRRRVAD